MRKLRIAEKDKVGMSTLVEEELRRLRMDEEEDEGDEMDQEGMRRAGEDE